MLNQSEGEKAESWLKNHFKEINVAPLRINLSKLKRIAWKNHRNKTITALEKNPDAEQNSDFYLDKIFKVDTSVKIGNHSVAIDLTVNPEPESINQKLEEIKSDRLSASIKEIGFDSHIILLLPDNEAERNRLVSQNKSAILEGIKKTILNNKSIAIAQAAPVQSLGAKLANQISKLPNLLQILPILQRNNIIIREKSEIDRRSIEIYQTPKPHEKSLKIPIKGLKLIYNNGQWLRDNTPPPKGMIQMPDNDVKNIMATIGNLANKSIDKEKNPDRKKSHNVNRNDQL